MSKSKKIKLRLNVTKVHVERELREANIYRQLMFDWINGLVSEKNVIKRFDAIFYYVRVAFETKYILALSKLFSGTDEESLWKLIISAIKVEEDFFELKLERANISFKDRLREKRKEFHKRYNNYIQRIKQIRNRLKPLRNTFIAHNYPDVKEERKTIWNELKEWTEFGEKVYIEAMDSVCEPRTAFGDFTLDDIDMEIKDFFEFIRPKK